ncbi:hypothetical protein KAH43_00720 [Candidatus Bipolaricaulota bacterium]|nr:hypothetical protein [Candidatus Bipolaricaulota bacterium]
MRIRDLFVIVVFVALLVIISACSEDGPVTYRVIHETNLYSSPSSGISMQTLRVGSIVTPANGAKTLSCTTTTEAGIAMELCQVDVSATNKRGWVLKKWVEKQ